MIIGPNFVKANFVDPEWSYDLSEIVLRVSTWKGKGPYFDGYVHRDTSERFTWPLSGLVETIRWDADKQDGAGLYGMLNGSCIYAFLLNKARNDPQNLCVQVVLVNPWDRILRRGPFNNYGEVKFKRGFIAFTGEFDEAMQFAVPHILSKIKAPKFLGYGGGDSALRDFLELWESKVVREFAIDNALVNRELFNVDA